jgi:hypothetical protein
MPVTTSKILIPHHWYLVVSACREGRPNWASRMPPAPLEKGCHRHGGSLLLRDLKTGASKMKRAALIVTALIFCGLSTPGYSVERQISGDFHSITTAFPAVGTEMGGSSLLQTVSCNPNDEDKQAYCMRACENSYLDCGTQYNKTPEGCKASRKDCESKCGC